MMPLISGARRALLTWLVALLAAGACAAADTRVALVVALIVVGGACRGNPETEKREHVTRGDAYVAQGKLPEAIIEYRAAVQLDAAYGEARFKLAEAYAKSNDPENAYPEYVRAADLLPTDTRAQLTAGQYLLLATRYEDARARARSVI